MLENYDSFVYNLARYLEELGEKVELVRNDRIRIDQIEAMLAEGRLEGIIFSPGPKSPAVSCGILPGIMRAYICENNQVQETELYPEDIAQFDEMFLTNSLLGVMPVVSLGEHRFLSGNTGHELLAKYREFCDNTEK